MVAVLWDLNFFFFSLFFLFCFFICFFYYYFVCSFPVRCACTLSPVALVVAGLLLTLLVTDPLPLSTLLLFSLLIHYYYQPFFSFRCWSITINSSSRCWSTTINSSSFIVTEPLPLSTLLLFSLLIHYHYQLFLSSSCWSTTTINPSSLLVADPLLLSILLLF